jgi:tRNA threonylcarbamoyladenosine biosynthesis protein TsaB
MRNLLAIDTSSEACSVALSLDGEILQQHLVAPLQHAELLLPAVHGLLDEAGISLGRLDLIVFGRGPGSFTSLRIGIGVVQGLAWGATLPVVPVSSLAAVAQQAIDCNPDGKPAIPSGYILVAMDARMSEVFHCTYAVSDTGILLPQTQESVSAPGAVTVTHPEFTVGAGNGFERYPELAGPGGTLRQVRPDLLPRATALIPLARQWLETNKPLPAAEAQPVYIRNHVADKPSRT